MATENKTVTKLRADLKTATAKCMEEIALTGRLRGEIRTINDKRDSQRSTIDAKQDIIDQLKVAIAGLERSNAKLEGYVERTNQLDRAQHSVDQPAVAPVPHPFRDGVSSPFGSPSHTDRFTGVEDSASYGAGRRIDWFAL